MNLIWGAMGCRQTDTAGIDAGAPGTAQPADIPLPNVDIDGAAPLAARSDGTGPHDLVGPVPVHPEAVALVRQQLETYETRHFCWQGEVWPSQRLDWEAIEEKPKESSPRDPASGNGWQTRLQLSLPNLGEVTASLRLDSSRVEVKDHREGLGNRINNAYRGRAAVAWAGFRRAPIDKHRRGRG